MDPVTSPVVREVIEPGLDSIERDLGRKSDPAARVTPAKPSQPAVRSPSRPLNCAPMLTIVIGTDVIGSKPRLLRDEDALPGGEMRWRLVAQTDDESVAAGVMELLIRRCYSEPPSLV